MINAQGPGLSTRREGAQAPLSTWVGDPISPEPRNPACGHTVIVGYILTRREWRPFNTVQICGPSYLKQYDRHM